MRVLLGLAALAATAQLADAQYTTTVTPDSYGNSGRYADVPPVGQSAFAQITVWQTSRGNFPLAVTPSGQLTGSQFLASSNWVITVSYSVNTILWQFNTNQYTAQMQYRWYPNYPNPAAQYPSAQLTAQSYTCDPCAGNTPVSCNTAVGPVPSAPNGTTGFQCSNFQRVYTMTGLVISPNNNNLFANSFAVQLLDRIQTPAPNVSSYSFTIIRQPAPIVGDPQIIGMQGQDFQVHGIPDEIFNMITYPNLQVNARFVYLSSGVCHDNFTACFAHPGTYISEEGIRLGADKIHVVAGSFKKGLTVSVNGKKVSEKKTSVKLGSVEMVNHRRVVVNTPIMTITISNSDKFLNQETALIDQKLLSLGSERQVLKDGESFHSEVPLHGLQGQTWRNVEYPSGLDYEGSISDYHVTSGNLYGTEFTFNQFKL
jgi:hypothetical protein